MVFFDALTGHQKFHHSAFESLYSDLDDIKADLVMIFGSCYSGLAVRGYEAEAARRSVEIVSAVDLYSTL